jgi:hypothetical protein
MIPEVRACSRYPVITTPTGRIERTPEPWGEVQLWLLAVSVWSVRLGVLA